jgi:hypothetical protein
MADIDVQRVLELAIRSAGQIGTDRPAWRGRIMAAIGDVIGIFNDHSDEWEYVTKLANATTKEVLVAKLVSYRTADKANRMVVTLQAKDRESEEIYTPWLDSTLGYAMRQKVLSIPPGTTCRIWKELEQWTPDASKPQIVNKMRVMINIEPIREDQPVAASPSAPPSAEAQAPAPAAATPSQPAGAGDPVKLQMLRKAIPALSAEEKVRLGQWAAEVGIANMMQPGDRADDVLKRCEELVAARG